MAKETKICTFPACACRATGMYCSSKPEKKKPKPIARQTAKAKRKAIDKSLLVSNDAAFYLEVWLSRPHICFECQEPITEHFSHLLMHHVLPKRDSVHEYSDYSQYRHCHWNIVILHHWGKGCHNTADADNAPRVRAYKEKLIAMHDAGLLDKVPFTKEFIQ